MNQLCSAQRRVNGESAGTSSNSLLDSLWESAARWPQKTALVFCDQRTTYEELTRQVELLAGALHGLGVERGDRVLLDMQNTPQLVIAHFAILRANAVVVPVNPMNRRRELEHCICDAGARVAIVTADLAREMVEASDALPPSMRLKHLVVSGFRDSFDPTATHPLSVTPAWLDWLLAEHSRPTLEGGEVHSWTELMSAAKCPPERLAGSADMALLPYTSGTTGRPKGCVHHHRGLLHNAAASKAWFGMTEQSVVLAAVPMFHITGIVAVMYAAITAGVTMVIMPRWDRDVAAHLILKWKVTSWISIPTMVVDIMASPQLKEYALGSLVSVGGGGAAMPQAVAQRLLEEFKLKYQEGYGLTETAGPSHSNPAERPKQQCLGVPFIGVDARVVDPETLKEVTRGEPGEIVVHGPQVFQGYWNRPEASAAAFVQIEGKRFFRTGDIGRVDEEGYYFMTDRLKRMINASGFKVWPAEVELMMYRHPAIQEACVIATRDAYRGESVKAVVVLRRTHLGTRPTEIAAWCRQEMAAYKVPREVVFVDALPKSASGKVLWRQLQEEEEARQLGAGVESLAATQG